MTKEIQIKNMKCNKCSNIVENVGENATKVTCSDCIQNELNQAIEKQEESIIPISNKKEIDSKDIIQTKPIRKMLRKSVIELLNKKLSDDEIMKELRITKKQLLCQKWYIAKENKNG